MYNMLYNNNITHMAQTGIYISLNKTLVVQWLVVLVLVSYDLRSIPQCNKFNPLWWHSFLLASQALARLSKTKCPQQLQGYVHLALLALAVL